MKRAWSISLFPFQQGVEVLIVQICTRFQSRLRSLKYLWFDQLPFSCWSSKILGPGTLLFKLAINSAYCIVPVHQLDRHLQGVYWWDQVFVEQAIPFGLSSVPILFIAVAGTIGRTLMETGVTLQMHYLEDYCFFLHHLAGLGMVLSSHVMDTLAGLGSRWRPTKLWRNWQIMS